VPFARRAAAAAVAAALLTGCAGASSTASGTPRTATAPVPTTTSATPARPATPASTAPASTPTDAVRPKADARITRISGTQWARIVATGTWRPGCPGGRSTFRRVDVGYWGFDGRAHRGALVVNQDVAPSVAVVFTRLFDQRFPIRRMVPIEAYRGDDDASMRADNTSALNCRNAAQANAPAAQSPHANGRAIDLNPYENPWIDPRCGCWRPSQYWGTHRDGVGVVDRGGAAVAAFRASGWIWRGTDSEPDLQHFDTGYPSVPFRS
jgi:hypothetical protein